MSGTSGKLGLFNTVLSNVACTSVVSSTLVDKVSWGTANCAEGTAHASPSTTQVMVRKNGGETDTDNNNSDFTNTATSSAPPRNSTSASNSSNPCTTLCANKVLILTITPQPSAPSGLACYETASFNTTTCSWDVSGSQPLQPSIACFETASFNTTTCSWDVTGTQPAQPSIACYETAAFNSSTCQWDVTGSQPAQPSIACYQSASFNGTTCAWDVTGTQPAQPSIACYQSATFNGTTCQWDVSGTQPAQPTGLACHETATFNTTTCAWVVTSSANITTDTAFGSYTWSANGQTYTNSGTYTIVPAVTSTGYSSLSTFNAAVTSAGYSLSSTQDFNGGNLTSGSFGPISWSASADGGFWFCQTPTNSISTNNNADPITFTFNPGVVAVGAHVFLTDPSCIVVPGNVSVSLSDGTTQTISTSSNQDFLGLVSGGSLITSITFSPSIQYITIDDLVIGTGTPSGSSAPCATDILNLTIIPGAPVGGTVVYDNSASSPMRNAVVVLKQGNAEVVRDTTDATGAFLLPLVTPGTYDVVVTSNTPWGGVNATDAVLILRSFSGSAPLNGIRLTAADVNGSASVNSTDALNALNRFTGALQTFSVGNYAASTSSYTASGAGTGSLNVSMLCYGDVNASYQPNGGFVRTSWKDLSTQGVARITSGSYEVPLFVSRGVQPAGVSLELELPEGLRVLGVRASEGLRANQVVYHQEGNRVRMAWLDESGAELKAGDVLCYVQVEGAVEGVWRSSTEVEMANVLGEVQSGVELRMPKLSASLGAMEASVYPNPGRGLRTLSLELSEGMGVAVRVTDALGRTVYTHTAGTLASGTHLMELNMEGWPVGSYQVQVLGATAEGKTHQRSITVLQTR